MAVFSPCSYWNSYKNIIHYYQVIFISPMYIMNQMNMQCNDQLPGGLLAQLVTASVSQRLGCECQQARIF